MNTMLASAQTLIRQAARDLGYDDATIEQFLQPEHEHVFTVTVDGKDYPAYRVQHNSKRGPYKGGIRFHPQVSLDEVRALATLMSLKTAASGLAVGGGKGGVAVDPRVLPKADVEAIARAYSRQLSPHLGSNKDVPGPDVNTDAHIMDWMVDEYQKTTGKTDPGAFTGKSIAAGGSEGRHPATGRGAVVVLEEYLRANDLLGKPLTLALQGFGNAGYFFAEALRRKHPSIKLVAIANSKHMWSRPEGIDVTKHVSAKELPRPEDLADLASAKQLPSADILSLKVDILALAALEDAITIDNVDSVQAAHIIELANGPITAAAEVKLAAKGVKILPDVIANAGGVIVSCLEWQQNLKGEHWPAAKVEKAMNATLVAAATDMLARAKERHISYKQAAFQIALQRLLD